jgi:dynein heavy chain
VINNEEMKNNVEELAQLTANLEAAKLELVQINNEESLLQFELSAFPQLAQLIALKDPYDKLWNTAYTFAVKSEQWLNGEFDFAVIWRCTRLKQEFARCKVRCDHC